MKQRSLGETMLQWLYSVKLKYVAVFYVLLNLTIRVIATIEDFPNSMSHQVCLTAIALISFYTMQHLYKAALGFSDMGTEPDVSVQFKKLADCMISTPVLALPVLPVFLFAFSLLSAGIVPMTTVGYIALGFGCSTFYLALIFYEQLVLLGKVLYDLGRKDRGILKTSATLLAELQSCCFGSLFAFFTMGILFTIEYAVLTPEEFSLFTTLGALNATMPVTVMAVWGVIFVFVIAAFPVLCVFFERSYKKLLSVWQRS